MDFNKFTTEQLLTTLDINDKTIQNIKDYHDAIIDSLDDGNKWLNKKSNYNIHVTILGVLYSTEHTITYLIEVTNSNRKIVCNIKNLVNLKDEGRVIIDNLDYIRDDLNIYYGKQDRDLEQQYEEYKKFTMKCDLLGVKYSIIEKSEDDYILTELVPDENGVATIPDFVTRIDTRTDSFLMNRFTKLIWHRPLVYSLNGLFTANDKIVNIDLSECNLSVIPTLSNVFYNCNNLKYVDFGDNDFHNVISMQSMFEDCDDLRRVEIPNAKFNRHCNLTGFINRCRKVTSLDMSKAEVYAEKPLGIIFYPKISFVLGWDTGVLTPNNLIKYKATSLAHILSCFQTVNNTTNRLTIYQLDELTGINYINSTTGGYDKLLNTDLIVLFVNNDKNYYSRSVLLKALDELQDNRLKEVQALDNAKWTKNYKYRLIVSNFAYMNSKSLCVIYFNKYSEWNMEDI